VDASFYTGIATDVNRRLLEHNGCGAAAGAKYTRGRRPVILVYKEAVSTRSAALIREIEIKRMSRLEKEHLVSGK
jgi:putative endonuclease